MRKCVKIFIAITFQAMLLLTGCEQDVITYKGPYHVRFTSNTGSSKESFSKPIDIQVHNVGPALNEDATIHFTVSGDAREGIDYVILGDQESVTIPAGEHFGNIQIQLINNANNILRSQDIIFTLQSVNDNILMVGQGDSQIGKEFTFTIFDDCILGGSYIGRKSIFSTDVKGITLISEDCETYILSNWNINFFNTPFDMDLTFIDKGDNTITIPTQEEDLLPEDEATMRGSGFVDPVTREITLTVELVDLDEEFTFTLIRD